MDDIRRPNPQRRDFAMRHRQNYNPPPTDPAQPVNSVPPAPTETTGPAAYAEPAYQELPAAAETDYQHYTQPTARAEPAKKHRRRTATPIKYAAAGLIILLLFGFAGYYLTRPAKKSGFTVAELSKKSAFGFYYPSPLPTGYVYDQQFNAFQDGQTYFMLTKGAKHIVFHEQSGSRLNTASLTKPKTVQSSAGKAAIGTVAGQTAAKVLAGSTLVSINTTGDVPATDVVQAINSLKAGQ